jgi:hypothetical protein
MISDYSDYFMNIFTDLYTNFRCGRFIRVSLKYLLLKLFSFNIYHDSFFFSSALIIISHSNGRSS